jgi:hypothetical protein
MYHGLTRSIPDDLGSPPKPFVDSLSFKCSFSERIVHSPVLTRGRFFMLATAVAFAALILLAYYFGVR